MFSEKICLVWFYNCFICAGPRVDNFQTLDPRKQELLEARFLGMRSTSNPAGGSGATLQHQQLQQHAATMAGSHSAGPPTGCHVMTTATTNQLVQHSLQQPSPSSLLNANAPPPPTQQQQQHLATPQFTATYTNPSTNNHGEHRLPSALSPSVCPVPRRQVFFFCGYDVRLETGFVFFSPLPPYRIVPTFLNPVGQNTYCFKKKKNLVRHETGLITRLTNNKYLNFPCFILFEN